MRGPPSGASLLPPSRSASNESQCKILRIHLCTRYAYKTHEYHHHHNHQQAHSDSEILLRYLLGYSSIAIDINSAKYLTYALLPLLQLKEIILVKQILQVLREDLFLLEYLFESSTDLGARLARLYILDQQSREKLAELIDGDPTVSIDINLLELRAELSPLIVVHSDQVDAFVDRIRVGQLSLDVLIVDDFRAVRRSDPGGQERIYICHCSLLYSALACLFA